MSCCADLKVSNFAEVTANYDIAKAIVDHFASENMKNLCVQQCPNRIARVSFEDKLACHTVRLRGELDIGGVKVAVLPPPPPPPNWTNVVVYNLPYDAPNSCINEALKFFGTVHSIRHQHWTNLPSVATGTRVARVNLKRTIPRFLKIQNYRCKVWYRGQPVVCDICKEGTHLASNCPHKGKCLSCDEVGHFARNCPTVCFTCKADHASDSCPNRRGWEHLPPPDNDPRPVTTNLDAGRADNGDACDDGMGPVPSSASSAGVAVASSAESSVDEPAPSTLGFFCLHPLPRSQLMPSPPLP